MITGSIHIMCNPLYTPGTRTKCLKRATVSRAISQPPQPPPTFLPANSQLRVLFAGFPQTLPRPRAVISISLEGVIMKVRRDLGREGSKRAPEAHTLTGFKIARPPPTLFTPWSRTGEAGLFISIARPFLRTRSAFGEPASFPLLPPHKKFKKKKKSEKGGWVSGN